MHFCYVPKITSKTQLRNSAREGGCQQIGAYAEFRQDWASALKYYGEAYKCLQEVPRGKEPYQLQRLAEIVLVSEQINFKLCTLLLHSGRCAPASQLAYPRWKC